jgi:hypothetical protein
MYLPPRKHPMVTVTVATITAMRVKIRNGIEVVTFVEGVSV